MITHGLCLWLGLACANSELPPKPVKLEPAKSVSSPLETVSLKPVDLRASKPIAFPSTCSVRPPAELKSTFVNASRKNPGISACDLAKQAWCESNFRVDAVSPAGAIGVSQFMPATAEGLGIDPWDPKESIEAQAKYVLWQRSGWTPPDFGGRTGEDIEDLGLGGYNWGRGNMYRSQRLNGWTLISEALPYLPEETQGYISCVKLGKRY